MHDAILLPPRPDVCQVCARKHPPEMPHDAQSLYYQMWFRQRRGRSVTWKDALAHCSGHMKLAWEAELKQRGVWTEPVTTKEEEVLTLIEGHEPIKELPPGAPIPPLITVTTHKIREKKRRRR